MTRRALLLFVLASCSDLTKRDQLPPQGQIVLGVTTDAWLPPGPGEVPDDVARTPLFERMRIEWFPPGEKTPCPDCFRDFGVDHVTMNEGRASVGFVPAAGTAGYRVRVRLFHIGSTESSAEPRLASTIEVVAALPVVAADGVVNVHVVLRSDDVGKPRGTLDTPVDAEPGPPPAGLAGTWHADVRRRCSAPAGPLEGCVPGGAYWMGDPSFAVPFERLVVVSPFFIDKTEVTTGEVRSTGLATLDTVTLKADPYLYSTDETKSIHYCTYTQRPADKEDMPVNCVTRDLASRICEKRGATLPTEAQWEFVAGARRDADFPWGDANATCDDAVYGRTFVANQPPEFSECVTQKGKGAAKPGSAALDRVALDDGAQIVDLAANLGEYALDTYQETSEPECFGTPFAIDPICMTPSKILPDVILVRSSDFTHPGGPLLRAAVRSNFTTKVAQDPRIGFRCARADH